MILKIKMIIFKNLIQILLKTIKIKNFFNIKKYNIKNIHDLFYMKYVILK